MVYNKQVVGLVSAGDGMCGAGNPDVYTKVSSFLPYIQSELKGGDPNLCIALDLDGKVGRSEPTQQGVIQNPTTQIHYYPVPGQYPPVGQYPVNQYPIAQYPIGQYQITKIQYYPVSEEVVSGESVHYPTLSQQLPIHIIQLNSEESVEQTEEESFVKTQSVILPQDENPKQSESSDVNLQTPQLKY